MPLLADMDTCRRSEASLQGPMQPWGGWVGMMATFSSPSQPHGPKKKTREGTMGMGTRQNRCGHPASQPATPFCTNLVLRADPQDRLGLGLDNDLGS